MLKISSTFYLISLLTAPFLYAQQAIDARAAGMAYSNAADTRGLQSVGLNPATLALQTSYKFEFNLLSINATANNNSFKKSQYDRYFTTGNLLSSADIDDIINSIPAGGLRADGVAHVNTISFYVPNFSLSLIGLGTGKVNVPKNVFELPLKGNTGQQGRIYNFDDAEGSDWVGIGVIASGAYDFKMGENSPLDRMSLGLSLKYYSGLHFDNVVKSRGELQNFDLENNKPFINLDGEIELLSADGGGGVGIDVGVLGIFKENFTFGITLLNVTSSMSWGTKAERRTLNIHGDSLSLPDRVRDSLIVDTDTSLALNSFATQLPAIMDFAFAYQPAAKMTVTAEYEQGLNDEMGGTKRPRVGFGFEYRGIPLLPLRAGFTFGGKTGASFALGAGLNFKNWYVDAAYLNHGRIIPDDFKGIGLALSSRLRF